MARVKRKLEVLSAIYYIIVRLGDHNCRSQKKFHISPFIHSAVFKASKTHNYLIACSTRSRQSSTPLLFESSDHVAASKLLTVYGISVVLGCSLNIYLTLHYLRTFSVFVWCLTRCFVKLIAVVKVF